MGFDSWFRGSRPYLWPCLYTNDMTRRVLSSVGLARSPSFFQGPQPLLHFQRFDAECDSVPPLWEQAVPEYSLVAFYGCVRLGADRFGAVNQLVFCVVLSQVSEGQSASHIYPVDGKMESFDLGPCAACVGKVSDQAYKGFCFPPVCHHILE